MSALTQTSTAWRNDAPTIGAVSLAHGLSHFAQLLVPPLFPWIGPAMGLSYVQLGTLLTAYYIVSCTAQTLAGFVVDRFGARRVLFGGLACLVLAMAGLALAGSYPMMMACMVLAGLGNSVFHPVDFSILNHRVNAARLGHAYAAHGISGNLGWALAPLFVVALTQATGSWRGALLASAALIAAVLIVLALVRTHLQVAAAPAGAPGAAAASGLGFLRLAAVWMCFAFFLFNALALGGVQSFAPAAAAALHGLQVQQMALCLSAYMLASAAGMVVGGHLVRDQQRSATVAGWGFGCAAAVALVIGLGQWPAWAVPGLFGAMGLSSGIAGPSRDLLVKRATPEGATGRVYGVVYSGLDVGMAIGAPIFGALMDAQQFRAVWVAIAIALLCMVASGFDVRRRGRSALAPAH
ncbi:MAG: MFS transporter [Burkholderiaceae bacterium]